MAIVLIEFDQQKYNTVFSCLQWLRTSEYKDLEQRKDFKLKPVPRSTFLSKEDRKCFQWKQDAWRFSQFIAERPENQIYIMKADSNPVWQAQDLPPLSAKFLAKEQEMLNKRDQKDRANEARRQKLQLSRRAREASKRLKNSAISEEDPLEVAERKEEAKKRKREALSQARKKGRSSSSTNGKSKKKQKKETSKEKALREVEDTESDLEEQAEQVKEVQKPSGSSLSGKKLPQEILKEVERPNDVFEKD